MKLFTRAIARRPGPELARGLTTATLGAPVLDVALAQHAAYVAALESAGVAVQVLPPAPLFPDACFVEDTAVITSDVAVITRPGAPSRRGEERSIEPLLERYRPIERIEPPGTLDGGDVLIVRGRAFIGVSERTNQHGARQLARILEGHGLACSTVPLAAGLHLKSSVNAVGDDALLIGRAFAGHAAFRDFRQLVIDDADAYACNVLWLGDAVIAPAGYPRVIESLDRLGLAVIECEMSEFRKLDGGLTCLSLRFA